MDTSDVLVLYLKQLMGMQTAERGPLLNAQLIPQDMGLIDVNVNFADYVRSFSRIDGVSPDPTGMDGFLRTMVRRVLSGYVPVPINDRHWEEVELDAAAPRQLEMSMRIASMQKLIADLYHVDLEFVGNNTKDEVGFGKEVEMKPEAEPVIERKNPNTVYATFSLSEKNQFDNMIFSYLCPTVSKDKNALKAITEAIIRMKRMTNGTATGRFIKATKANLGSDRFFLLKFWKLQVDAAKLAFTWPADAQAVGELMHDLRPYAWNFLTDLANAHVTQMGDEKFYQVPELFQQQKDKLRVAEHNPDLFPELLSPTRDVWNMKSLNIQTTELR
jgi:hypothetical protein